MTEDQFDRELAARLRAYESRLPEGAAPDDVAGRRQTRGLPILVAGGVAALAAVVLALVGILNWGGQRVGGPDESAQLSSDAAPTTVPSPIDSPTPTAQVEPSGAPSAQPSARPSASADPSGAPSTDLAWSLTGSFGPDGGGPSMVQHIVQLGEGFVAAGVAYAQPLPNVGPTPPHTLPVWLSPDGRSWEQVASGLENVRFGSLVVREDGALLATGTRGTLGESGSVEGEEPAAWTSPDGRTWTEIESGLPGFVIDLVRGGRGYLALVSVEVGTEDVELWHSPDAVTWTLAHRLVASRIDVGAGDEGFVAVGRTAGDPGEPFAIASGDGRVWVTAANPPPAFVPLVAPRGGDWMVMSTFDADGGMANGETWVSANGLDWAPHGRAPMGAVKADGTECREYPRFLVAAGPWLVAATDLMYPCSEGGFAVHATQLISTDGATFSPLPFEAGTPGQARSGAIVNAAVVADGGLVLAGELDGVATFWVGEER